MQCSAVSECVQHCSLLRSGKAVEILQADAWQMRFIIIIISIIIIIVIIIREGFGRVTLL